MIIPRGATFPAGTQMPVQDILTRMDAGTHFHYRLQEWRDGHDHVHVECNDGTFTMHTCGGDLSSCEPFMVRSKGCLHGIIPADACAECSYDGRAPKGKGWTHYRSITQEHVDAEQEG